MSLRLKINLLVGLLTLLFLVSVIWLQLLDMRSSVHEEVQAAHRVATQLLSRTVSPDAPLTSSALLGFLQGTGRVRSSDIALYGPYDNLLYRSPPSPYKSGRDAPRWFERLVAPPVSVQTIEFRGGRLAVSSNASRAVLDAWDDVTVLVAEGALVLVLVNALVFWLVGRTVRPLGRIVAGLNDLQAGRFETRMPPLAGSEPAAIGLAFNRMAAQLQQQLETERRAVRAELQLSDSKALTRWIDRQIESERHLIARELHDELGQSVTAMRSMALSIARRVQAFDPEAETAARLIAEESSRLYAAMHGMIPRLTPLLLDSFGLAEALQDLAERTRRNHPAVALDCRIDLADVALESDAALALFRTAQEGISNALRHGEATRLRLAVSATPEAVGLVLEDDGRGLPAEGTDRSGHFGLRWLAERVQSVGGALDIGPGPTGGVRLAVRLPLQAAALAVSP